MRSKNLNRRIAAASVALAAAMGLGGLLLKNSVDLDKEIREVYAAKSAREFEESSRRLSRAMERSGRRSLSFDGKSSVEASAIAPENTTIVDVDSPLLKEFFGQMGEGEAGTVRKHVKWVLFSPNVESEHFDVNGLSLGGGLIALDTKADDGTTKNHRLFPPVLGHEGGHEADVGIDLSRVMRELRAQEAELRVLECMTLTDPDETLRAAKNETRKRCRTAEFLDGLRPDFNNVYPGSVILAKGLLEADVDGSVLREYGKRISKLGSIDGPERELVVAAYIADNVRSMSREDAIKFLYRIVTKEEYSGTLLQASAASALQYLCPNVGEEESTADFSSGTSRSVSISFGKRQRRSGIGKGSTEDNGYDVSELPSMEEFLDDKRFDDCDPVSERPANTKITARYRFYSGAKIKKTVDKDGIPVIYFPKREGRPAEGFWRCYMDAVDTDRNGRRDQVRVWYGSNKIIDPQGNMLAKIDHYGINSGGEAVYTHSGFLWFSAREGGRDLPLDVEGFARKAGVEGTLR